MIVQLAIYAMAAIMVVAIFIELRTGKIPNWLTLLPPLLFIVTVFVAADWTLVLWQLALGVGVFLVGVLLFLLSGFPAGATKLMAGVALFVPLSKAHYALGVLVAAMFVSAFAIGQIRKYFGSETSDWKVLAKAVLPMSLPIGIAGIAAFFVL